MIARRRLGALAAVLSSAALVAAAVGAAWALGSTRHREAGGASCPQPTASAAYRQRVVQALRSNVDLWGNALLAAPSGPTYDGARNYLAPLLLARAPRGRPLTDSGAYYLPFAQPLGVEGGASVALHVADGSQIVSQRVAGRTLAIGVGDHGQERFGSCLGRLAEPRLSEGYLPILETQYTDSAGVRYRQQSFAVRIPQTRSLVSFVSLAVDGRESGGAATQVRFTPSVTGLVAAGQSLVRDGRAYLLFGSNARWDGRSLSYIVPPKGSSTIYVAWLDDPAPVAEIEIGQRTHDAARRSLIEYWTNRLARGTTYQVPEQRVLDAERSLLIQELVLTWRYSIGNPYEEFSYPESIDVAQVLDSYGFEDVAHAILRKSLRTKLTPYANWKMGEKLVASAFDYRLFADGAFSEEVTPALRGYVSALGSQISASPRGILRAERYSSDIPDSVYGLHSQVVVWQGLRSMGDVWTRTGHAQLGALCLRLAARLESGLRAAVRASQTRLPDGSLFIPARLLEREPPHDALTASRAGSYWNLVVPYALAAGFFAPGSAEERGALAYMLRHGSRLLGLVRAGAYALYRDPVYPTSGTDEVYGVNVARFLADNHEADQLVLSLYGHLAAGMTGTFVSGEAASVAPLENAHYRAMYLPPNAASNAALLETLRLMLVHERRGPGGKPVALELASATPRAWLMPGKRIVVRAAPTSFGSLSFVIAVAKSSVHVTLDVPKRTPPRALSVRLRLPGRNRITAVTLDGHPYARFDSGAETIDLSGRSGRIELAVAYETA